MSLSSKSNTINALGIFGRLEPAQEKYFQSLESKYSKRPDEDDANGIFNHLTLVINRDVIVGQIPKYLELLKELKNRLPLKLQTSGVIIKEDKHLGLTFNTIQTKEVRNIAEKHLSEGIVETPYTKVVWFVPTEYQPKVKEELLKVKEITFYDFILVANRQNSENTIYSSKRF